MVAPAPGGPLAERGAALGRHGADGRRHARHERGRDRAGPAARGVRIGRLTALPDRLEVVRDAFAQGLERADLVVSTGGLGPTPDDLTREAIAAVLGQTPTVDPELEAWLRELWRRRGMVMPDMNLKQAWLIPSGDGDPEPERNGARLVDRRAGRPRDRRPPRARRARCGRCGATGFCHG